MTLGDRKVFTVRRWALRLRRYLRTEESPESASSTEPTTRPISQADPGPTTVEIAGQWARFADHLEHFTKVRAARAPRDPLSFEPPERQLDLRAAAASHDRETLASYHESFRQRGVNVMDALQERDLLTPQDRERVEAPSRPSDLKWIVDHFRAVARSFLRRAIERGG